MPCSAFSRAQCTSRKSLHSTCDCCPPHPLHAPSQPQQVLALEQNGTHCSPHPLYASNPPLQVLALKQDGKLLLVRGTPAELALQKMLPPPCPPPSSQAAADAVGCTPMDFQAVATGMGRTFSAQKLAVSLAKPEGVLGQHAVAVLAPGSGPLSTPFFTDASLGSLGLSDPCVHADVTGNKKWLQSGVTAAGARLPRTGHSHHAPSASPGEDFEGLGMWTLCAIGCGMMS